MPETESRNIDVDVQCCDVSLTCPFNVVKRLLSASDRKLFGIDMQLIFDESALTPENTFTANIIEKYDYGNERYALCECLGTKIILPLKDDGKTIGFGVDLNNASIYDVIIGIIIT